MSNNDSQQIVNKAWNFAHVLRDDGLSYMAYTEQITFMLFLKMAHEQTKPPYNKPSIVLAKYNWESLLKREGDELEAHYRHILEELGKQPGMLGEIFKKARPEIQNPATLRRLIVDLIDVEKWSSMDADVKGDIYEGLLSKSASESPKGAGQYFTPRELIKAIVDCVQPTVDDTVCDPAAGTGGFLLAAYDYVAKHQGKTLDKDQKKHLRTKFVKGWESPGQRHFGFMTCEPTCTSLKRPIHFSARIWMSSYRSIVQANDTCANQVGVKQTLMDVGDPTNMTNSLSGTK